MANISVIIPCYNVEKYLNRCLDSIVQQTFGVDNLEIICIDDASTDHTWEILLDWEKRYPDSIVALQCPVNGRQGTARNIGLEYASAPWISYIDSDDWIEPDYFEKLYKNAEASECEVVMCRNKRDSSDALTYFAEKRTGKENQLLIIDTVEKRKTFMHYAMMEYSAWGKLIRREVLTEHDIFFPENLAYEDVFWGVLMHLYVKSVYIIEERLYHYYVNQNSTVLQKDSFYHIDMLTVQLQLWDELGARGMFGEYYEELEYEFLISCYLSFLKLIALRFEKPPYSYYQILKTCVLERVPDYKQNKYVNSPDCPQILTVMLQSLEMQLNKAEFEQFAKQIRAAGI